jgi:catalase
MRDGSMTYHVDAPGANPHVNYEPSSLGGLQEADASYREYRPYVSGQAMKATIDRENNYQQAGERYRAIPQWERDDLIKNLVDNLKECDKHIQEKMVWHFGQCDQEYGARVAQGLGITIAERLPVAAGR